MPSFADISQRLGEMATGFTVGTLEREQADRAEARQLTDTAISRGAQGIDVAPFYTADQFRPATAPVLERLQQASGPVGPGTPSDAAMLQRPHAERIQLEAERLQAQRTAAEETQQRLLEGQDARERAREAAALERQNQRQVRRRDSLNPAEWNALRGIEATVVDNMLSSQTPDYWLPGQTGVAVAPQYAAARASIIRALEMRIPQHIVFDPGTIRDMLSEHLQDISTGITVTAPSSHTLWHPFTGTPGSIQYSEAAARPRREDTSGASVGTGGAANPPGTTAAPMPANGAQVGRSSAPEQARTQRTLDQWNAPITAAAREFNLSPQFLAAVFGSGEGGQMVQGPIIPNRTERAFGVAQVLPSTYNQVARELREGRPFTDPTANIRVGTAYLAKQMRDYNGDVALALAAYNWGPENLNRMMRRFPDGVSRQVLFQNMPRETIQYLDRIGAGAGGWDSATLRTALPGIPAPAAANQPAGTPTGNVTQRAPTAQEQGPTNQYIDSVVRSIATQVTSITDITRRPGAKEALLTALPDSVRRNYSPSLVDHIVAEVRRQLHGVQ